MDKMFYGYGHFKYSFLKSQTLCIHNNNVLVFKLQKYLGKLQ